MFPTPTPDYNLVMSIVNQDNAVLHSRTGAIGGGGTSMHGEFFTDAFAKIFIGLGAKTFQATISSVDGKPLENCTSPAYDASATLSTPVCVGMVYQPKDGTCSFNTSCSAP